MKRVNIEQARKLKELGFDIAVDGYYDIIKNIDETIHYWSYKWDINSKDIEGLYSAPYIAEALEWIRNEKGIPCSAEHHCIIAEELAIKWVGSYGDYINNYNTQYTNYFDTYEEAESALLDELLTILEEK